MRRLTQNQKIHMRHRIKIQSRTDVLWQDLISVWSDVKPETNALQMFDSGMIFQKCTFILRYTTEINQTMRICYDDKIFEVDSITDIEARKRYIKISAHATSYLHKVTVIRPVTQVTSEGETKQVDTIISSDNLCAVNRNALTPGEQTEILNQQHYILELITSSDVDVIAGDKLYITVYGKTTYYIAGEPYVSRMNMKVPLLREDEA